MVIQQFAMEKSIFIDYQPDDLPIKHGDCPVCKPLNTQRLPKKIEGPTCPSPACPNSPTCPMAKWHQHSEHKRCYDWSQL